LPRDVPAGGALGIGAADDHVLDLVSVDPGALERGVHHVPAAQPMITSSTSSASTLARSSAACTTCPPIFAPCVMLSAPRQLLQSGVRAVETMTASVMETLLRQTLKRFPSLANFASSGAGFHCAPW